MPIHRSSTVNLLDDPNYLREIPEGEVRRVSIGDSNPNSPTIDVDQLTTEPLTESEAREIYSRIRIRMVTKGIRSDRALETMRDITDGYLREIGKSRTGKIYRVGMGWFTPRNGSLK